MNITITHTLSNEAVNLLERIFSNNHLVPKQPVAETIAPAATVAKAEKVKNTPAATTTAPAEAPAATTDTAVVEYKQEDVRAETTRISQAGKRDEVKNLLTSFGAAKLTELKKEDYAAYMEKLAAL